MIKQDKITLLDMKIDLINVLNLVNIKDITSYKLVNQILHMNRTYKFMQSFKELVMT